MLRQCKLLVWDESTMVHKNAVEALNRTLQDLRNNNNVMEEMLVLLHRVPTPARPPREQDPPKLVRSRENLTAF